MRRLFLLASCIAAIVVPPSMAVAAPDDADVSRRANDLLAQMTPAEKAGQLVDSFVFQDQASVKKAEDQVASGALGAALFLTDPAAINRLQHAAVDRSRLKIPLLFGFDVIHGLTAIFPVPIANAASWDPDGVEKWQAIAAQEARAVGVTWAFAPMVDIARDARWGRMVEGAGEDPYLGSAMAAAQVRGFQGPALGTPGHILSGPKHFAAYGAALGGRDYEEANVSDEALWNVYLPPFEAGVKAGAGNIMSAYMPINGVPASANHWLLTDVLRNTWGFKGFVVSDAGVVENLKTDGFASDMTDAATRALAAGLDMEMTALPPAMANLPAAIAQGKISAAQLDDAVRRVLEAKIRMGIFEHPFVDETNAAKSLGTPDHIDAARIAAERAAVLLRNEGGLLPLDATKVKHVAVLGPLADSAVDALGSWAFAQNHPIKSSILEGIRNRLGTGVDVVYAPGCAMPRRLYPSMFDALTDTIEHARAPEDETAMIAQAVSATRQADVAIVVVGERQNMSGESASTSTLDLPGRQQDMLDAVVATGKPVVIVLMNGRPLDLKETRAAAILEVWHPGSAAGAATANLVFGDAVPGGKLPMTWPRNAAQEPLYYAHLTTHEPRNAGKRYWNEPNTPAYPFGFGLSYAPFQFSNLRLDRPAVAPGETVLASVDLKNTGTHIADEVAQLYIHQRSGTAARPVRELKGFSRVTLKPGETRTLSFKLSDAEFRYWNAAKKDWTIDDSVFDVAIGGDSTVPFGATFETVRR